MLHCLRSNVTVNAIRYFCIFDSNPFKEPDLVSSSRDFGLSVVSKIENRQQSALKIERQNPRLNKINVLPFCPAFLHFIVSSKTNKDDVQSALLIMNNCAQIETNVVVVVVVVVPLSSSVAISLKREKWSNGYRM